MKFLIVSCLLTLHNQLVTPQFLRPPPYNLLNRPLEPRESCPKPAPPPVIPEPCPSPVSLPIPPQSSTTLITDCSPAICQNLANTIQLMIVCNLLKNNKNPDLAMQLASPIINEVMTSPILSCGCPNPISPSVIPNFPPNVIAPNFPPNLVTPNFITPSVGPNIISPNYVAPNVYPPNVVAPMLPPRVVAPNNVLPGMVNSLAPNLPGSTNGNNLLSTIMSMLGNIQ